MAFVLALLLLLPLAIALSRSVYLDYRGWRSLGPGGLPYNPFGYFVQLLGRVFAHRDVRTTSRYIPSLSVPLEGSAFLRQELPFRRGSVPQTGAWIAPHRQLEQYGDTKIRKEIASYISSLAASYPLYLEAKSSVIEAGSSPPTPALFVATKWSLRPSISDATDVTVKAKDSKDTVSDGSENSDIALRRFRHRYFGKAPEEIAHAHHSDGSLHLLLSSRDCTTTLERGWGERHALAGRMRGFPLNYVMIYAPRDKHEVEVVKRIIRAAAAYCLDGTQPFE